MASFFYSNLIYSKTYRTIFGIIYRKLGISPGVGVGGRGGWGGRSGTEMHYMRKMAKKRPFLTIFGPKSSHKCYLSGWND